MEAARPSAQLFKENVESSSGSGGGGALLPAKRYATPKSFAVHADSAPSVKKGLQVKRRALGDISNQQRRRLSNGGDDAVRTSKSLKSGGVRKSEVVRVMKAKKSAAKPVATAQDATFTQPAKLQEVEDVEHAYGGLVSPEPDTSYLASLRAEMLNDIMNNKTRSLIDDFEPTDAFGVWDDEDERKMLATGAAPSSWWSQATADFADDASADPLWDDAVDTIPTVDDVPPPDDLPAPVHDATESDDLLDDLLSVDVDAACQ
ncbi:hypothetical protein PybrP1_011527 [[Pythium] brassicae (nom. inval.)]|nr:hypothetical protein PybrP1_011527 [[Pythium] brassicae (nom. inval.)]